MAEGSTSSPTRRLSLPGLLVLLLIVGMVGCTSASPRTAEPATPSPAASVGASTTPNPTDPPAARESPTATASATDAPPAATGQPPATPPGADVTPRPAADLPSALVFARAKVGSLPSSMAWAGGRLWLGNGFGVTQLDPATGAAIQTLDFGPLASVEAIPHTDMLLAASYMEESIALVDPTTGALSSATEVPCPGDFAPVSVSEVWVTSPCTNAVALVALGSGVTDRVQVSGPGTIAVGGGAVWVTGDSTVVRIDPDTLDKRHVFPPALGFPNDIEYVDEPTGAAGLWVNSEIEVFVTSSTRGSLVRIDPDTLEVESIDAGNTALLRILESMVLHDGDLWTVGVEPGGWFFEVPRVLTRVDIESGTVVDELAVPPGSIALAGGTESDTLWLGAPMDEVLGLRTTEGSELPQPTVVTREGEMNLQTASYAGHLPDHVYLPGQEPSLPTFVLIGGGPVPPSEVHHMSALATALAANGAVVHVVGYRSEATGAGMDETLEDIRCAVAYARSRAADFGGSAQVVLAGFSYGGEAVVSASTTDGPSSQECAANGEGVADAADAVIALDGFPYTIGDTGQSVPMLFVGATGGGNGFRGQQLAEAMHYDGYEVESVVFQVDHRTAIDPSPTIGVVSAILDFASRLGD